jgi:site-specific recombinase XerD
MAMLNWYEQARENLQLRGLADRTVQAYLREIRKISDHYQECDPRALSEAQVREYILHRRNVDKLSAASLRILYSAFKHYYLDIQGQTWKLLEMVRAKREKKLPVVLTQDEVTRIINAVSTLHNHTFLWTLYSCGLRLQEGLHLQVRDIDSKRMMLHVHRGKGAKERYVPIPVATLKRLRRYWRTHRKRIMRLEPFEFIRRFLQHVLPKGFQRLRHYGFCSPASNMDHETLCTLVQLAYAFNLHEPNSTPDKFHCPKPICPLCGGTMTPCKIMPPSPKQMRPETNDPQKPPGG